MQILTGRPHRLLDMVISRIGKQAAQGQSCMLLVPSQYTLQAEIEVMTRLNLTGSFLIDVLSPGRLQSRVFERAGQPKEVILDDRGKQMVLAQIAAEESENLLVYRNSAANVSEGFVSKLSSLIADFKRSKRTAAEIMQQAEKLPDDDSAKRKLLDAARLYAAYEQRMEGRLADAEDVSREMLARLSRSEVLAGQAVFVYGFDMITPTFASELLALNSKAKSLTLAIETDANAAPDGRLFAPVNASIDRLRALAKEQNITIQIEKIEREKDIHDDLRNLERNLFALGKPLYDAEPEHITLTAYSNARAEAHGIASQIRRILAGGGDSSDVAVVYPKGSGYAAILSGVFPLYGLPIYLAEKRKSGAHPLCRCLLAAIAAVSDGWRTPDVLEYVRSGFAGLTDEAADALCAYADGTALREKNWKQPFTYIKHGTEDELNALNEAREIVVNPLESLETALRKAKTANDTIGAIIRFLEAIDAFDTLGDMRMELEAVGLSAEAEDCAQVWNLLMETLDQLHTLLEGNAASAKLVLNLLRSGLSALELSALPPADGAIICGEIGNVRTAEVGTLFAIGMNDMQAGADEGLLSQSERETAARATGAYLGMSASERAALALLDILKVFSGAKERLVVSLPLADETGRALREGVTVQSLRRAFPKLVQQGGLEEAEQLSMLTAPDASLEALAVHFSDAADERTELEDRYAAVYAAMQRDEEASEKLRSITRALSTAQRQRLDSSMARTLYGRPVMSVSRLETFAGCPYQHFVRYGLAPKENMEPGVDRSELGTLYHEAAEQFTRAVMALPEFPNIRPQDCDRIMEQAVAPLVADWKTSPLGESSRGEAIARRIRRTAARTGRNIVAQYADSRFRPMQMELVFGQNGISPIMLELADGSFVYLQGRIDRVDVLDGEGKSLRIVDYKSSEKKFDPTRAYWGLQLQLLLYLSAALSRYPGMEPAGFFYCHIDDPTIKTESRIREEIERQIAKKLSLAGISLSDVQILRAQDSFHEQMVTKDGKPNARSASSMADSESMRAMMDFARRRAAHLAGEAYAGEIGDSPAELGQWNACQYCGYAAVCGFDPSIRSRRRLQKKKAEDLR